MAVQEKEKPKVEAGYRSRPAPPLTRRVVRIRLVTEYGDMVLALDGRRAPVTTSNFLRYIDSGRLDNTTFYRAARTRGAPERGFIQGGIDRTYRRMFPPIPEHESTSRTGLTHQAGTISMAKTSIGPAIGEFFIVSADMPYLDARADHDGYAAFGRVVEGMDVVRRILASPTSEFGRGSLRGQMIADPVRLIRAERIDSEPAEPRHVR